jgi:pyridoxine 5-phosphate synthase
MALLGVNVDHIATLRQARGVDYPSPVVAAKLAQDSGADQITCHLREDRRHIQDEDITVIQRSVTIPVNLEMAATEKMTRFALQHRPGKVTLVPERRQELTTEGGLDVRGQFKVLEPIIARLKQQGIFVSLFIDPVESQIRASRETGAQAVELHTGEYCNARGSKRNEELERLRSACRLAKDLEFFLAAGHGLNYENILPVLRIPQIEEFNIGHAIVAHAVIVGWERAVREMKSLIQS